MVEISFSIWGNKFSSDGYQQLLRIGSVGPLEDVVYPEFTDKDIYFSVINKTDKVVYALTKSNISSYGAGRGGRLRMGIAIPKGYRISQAISPYALLKELYDHYCVGYLRIIGNSAQFKQDQERPEEFKEILGRYPLEVYNGPWKPMNEGTSAKAYVILSEDKIAELFKDTQYEELREYNELIVASAGSSMQFTKLNLEVPRIKKYKVYRNRDYYTTVTGRSFTVNAPSPSRRGFRFIPDMVSPDIANLSDGEPKKFDGCIVRLDEMNETIYCDFSEKAVEVKCRVALVGAEQILLSNLSIQAAGGYAQPIGINDDGSFVVSGNDIDTEWRIICNDKSYILLTEVARIDPSACTLQIKLEKKQIPQKIEKIDRVPVKEPVIDDVNKKITVRFDGVVPAGELIFYFEFNDPFIFRHVYTNPEKEIELSIPERVFERLHLCTLKCHGYDIGACKQEGQTFTFECTKKKRSTKLCLLFLIAMVLGILIGAVACYAVLNVSIGSRTDNTETVISNENIDKIQDEYKKKLDGLKNDPLYAKFETWKEAYQFLLDNETQLSVAAADKRVLQMTDSIISNIAEGDVQYFKDNYTFKVINNTSKKYNTDTSYAMNLRSEYRSELAKLIGDDKKTELIRCIDVIALGTYGEGGRLTQYVRAVKVTNSNFKENKDKIECFADLKKYPYIAPNEQTPVASQKIDITKDKNWTSADLEFATIMDADPNKFDTGSKEILGIYKEFAEKLKIGENQKTRGMDSFKKMGEWVNTNIEAFSSNQKELLIKYFTNDDVMKEYEGTSRNDAKVFETFSDFKLN